MSLNSFIDRYEDVMSTFERRATRQEFPALKYIIYLNFASVISLNGGIIDSLLRYGTDVLYPKLLWPDKFQILDLCNRANAPYKYVVFNKVKMDVMLSDY